MKKPSTLAEQVRQAQKAMSDWSELQKSTVYLQGTDVFLTRRTSANANHPKHRAENIKQKAHA